MGAFTDLIVHLGSGSGSLLTCVLGQSAVDFLRLIAIGNDEICWNEGWDRPPEPEPSHAVQIPAEMGDTDTHDTWCAWVNASVEPC